MKLSYKKLWVKLVEQDLKKTEFAKKAGIKSYTLYRLRQNPSKMDQIDIVKISDATGIDDKKISELSLFFARKVDKLQHLAS